MDDSLAKDQLNLWEKLNRLYGDKQECGDAGYESDDAGAENKQGEDPADTAGAERESPAGSLTEDRRERVHEVCADCKRDCPQRTQTFIIDRCPKTSESLEQEEGTAVRQSQMSSMGLEKINETCRRCKRSCKQSSPKLNKMLCLGFIPIGE